MKKKSLLLGATGLLGSQLKVALEPETQLLTPDSHSLDVTDLSSLRSYLEQERPSIIINAIGLHGVTRCEANIQLAKALNRNLPEALADYCKAHKARLIHFSCADVYGPEQTNEKLLDETTATNPQSIYAQTKLLGDQAIQQYCDDYLIFRLSALYDSQALQQTEHRDPILAGAPTAAFYVAETVARSLSRIDRQVLRVHPGIYHLCAKGGTDWDTFNQEVIELKNTSSVLSKSPIGAVSSAGPSLNLAKVEDAFCLSVPEWRAQLRSILNDYAA